MFKLKLAITFCFSMQSFWDLNILVQSHLFPTPFKWSFPFRYSCSGSQIGVSKGVFQRVRNKFLSVFAPADSGLPSGASSCVVRRAFSEEKERLARFVIWHHRKEEAGLEQERFQPSLFAVPLIWYHICWGYTWGLQRASDCLIEQSAL